MSLVRQAAEVVEALKSVANERKHLLLWGVVFVVLGILAPRLIKVSDVGILPLAEQSVVTGNLGCLLFAAVRLVLLNTIRALPNYIGVLLIAEGLGMLDRKPGRWFKMLVLLLIPAIYEVIDTIYGIKYDFGIPAISLIFVIMIVNRNHDMARSIMHKIMVFALLLFGVQWLDIVPALTGYGFGRGNVSTYLKDISMFLEVDNVLNTIGISLFIIFVVNAFIIARLLNIYTREIKVVEQALELEHLNNELKLQSMENRSLREIQSLVHDLKTPLTSIQGLAGVIAITEDRRSVKKHADYISAMVDKMSIMINELLQDDSRQVITIRELIEYAVAHVPQLNDIADFNLIIKADSLVLVNKIKVARAIINILENAVEAVNSDNGSVAVLVKQAGGQVKIEVTDNGQGFREEHSGNVWESGFSTKESSGLGLPFVRDVLEKNNGHIVIGNHEQGGAKVVINLPEVSRYGEKNDNIGG